MMLTPNLIQATYIRDYIIHLQFSDGASGEIDLENELWGPVFEPLKDADLFRQFELNEEFNTITWPTGADLAPEYLYECVAPRQPAT